MLLDPEYIPSKDNTVPEQLSRIKGGRRFPIGSGYFPSNFGSALVAGRGTGSPSWSNTLCNRFNSCHHDVGSGGVDAFLQDWRRERNWANPPWSLPPPPDSFPCRPSRSRGRSPSSGLALRSMVSSPAADGQRGDEDQVSSGACFARAIPRSKRSFRHRGGI